MPAKLWVQTDEGVSLFYSPFVSTAKQLSAHGSVLKLKFKNVILSQFKNKLIIRLYSEQAENMQQCVNNSTEYRIQSKRLLYLYYIMCIILFVAQKTHAYPSAWVKVGSLVY